MTRTRRLPKPNRKVVFNVRSDCTLQDTVEAMVNAYFAWTARQGISGRVAQQALLAHDSLQTE